jgi:hypothetical protein
MMALNDFTWPEMTTPRKVCRCCGSRRVVSKFHRDRTQRDGLSARCKACVSKHTAAWAARNRTRKNATDLAWKHRNKHKDHARGAVRRAVASGALKVPLLCQDCRAKRPLEAHHTDYNRPLAVRWLCKPCHAESHDWGRKAVA